MNLRVVYSRVKPVRVRRGGSWNYSAINYKSGLRAAIRNYYGPSNQYYYIGARLSRSLGGKNEPKGDV
jgi:formylglycine-generating enzyme required for sulfatase activity